MKVRVLQQVQGTRNGVEWPPRGALWDLPDDEAHAYANAGLVEVVEEPHRAAPRSHDPDAGVERAVAADDVTVEKRGPAKPGEPMTTATGPAAKR